MVDRNDIYGFFVGLKVIYRFRINVIVLVKLVDGSKFYIDLKEIIERWKEY